MVCSSGLHNAEDVKILESIQRGAMKLGTGLEGVSCNDSLRIPGLSSLGKKSFRGKLVASYIFLRRGSREGPAGLRSVGTEDRMCRNGAKLQQRRFRLDIRKKLFLVRVVKHWYRLHREVVMPHACLCSRDIRTMPSVVFYHLISPKYLSSWTRVLFKLTILVSSDSIWF